MQAVCEELYILFAMRFALQIGARIFSAEQENGVLQKQLGYSPKELELLRTLKKQMETGAPIQDQAIAEVLNGKSVKTVSNQLNRLYRKKFGDQGGDKIRLIQEFNQELIETRYYLQQNILRW